ncbi:CHY zinc finger protein [Corynebacterium sp. 153RC1]|uniref:CHY zinc finger protein n=1 Tax=unclassified Corynebacterium TaxID=2624378 RepID=UPI00211CCCEE|nr:MULTISPECIES: CHY zinc finger protein [unclassified Corynebacterium]MCQ9370718.1 CHY zinc finger protein [Corynebacterium sp. 35RC1]MCQ9352650.1 CHY zinc finger protein [Corynebacterium sp. 209RC1]MCQ9354834.1 CHY zinc finger protein [Corynebacterium sp. 1222RC1]MCQ9357019.1 CHY zinc finger protein [Corynebacterium sp. 122RC1]MCQ9359102.1 CHY zinc finger protein [Corynebacterium sp. 142RC1]
MPHNSGNGTSPQVRGQLVDSQGRCQHYHSQLDVVANKCVTCGQWWACHKCHEEAQGHRFGPMPTNQLGAMCCACGEVMTYPQYAAQPHCPSCQHPFNPGCHLHAPIYWQLG